MKTKNILTTIITLGLTMNSLHATDKPADAANFYTNDKLFTQKVSFVNQYKLKQGARLFLPEGVKPTDAAALPAIIVGHPMGAVKEQSAQLYATKMAELGFATLAIDLPFWGDSEGQPRNAVSPDMYAEAFSAAVDYLRAQPYADPERIGVIGICGSGCFAISAAKIDPRIKAVATISMYDMGTATRSALGNSQSLEARKAIIATAAAQRDVEFAGGKVEYTSGCPHEIDEDSHPIAKEFYSFYRTERGEVTPEGQSPELTTHPTLTSNMKFMNFYPFSDMDMVSPRAMLFITGDQAHSKEFSEAAYKLASQPKELHWVKGAGHVDLYDRDKMIPWDKLKSFFEQYLAP